MSWISRKYIDHEKEFKLQGISGQFHFYFVKTEKKEIKNDPNSKVKVFE